MAQPSGQQQSVPLTSLPLQQLSQLQSRLSSELEHLSASYQRLRAAQSRFKDCIRSIKDGVESKTPENPLLIPLTPSLYVPARPPPSKPVTVLVDIGTGFYVEKSTSDATKFYDGKIEDLTKNLTQIEEVVRQKTDTLRAVEDGMRRKVVAGEGQDGGQAGRGAGDEGGD
ncbi:prefoldin, alpha subunit [Cyphellophora europaea CBS 101466]|uniref:Prefoldin, alpha subunit n=1 Tax=Cyphellophora europaea (strain CBS 101466) TaxID=1220924 RepID=W2S286_CYPE1|nr:prefoldin, alpha subunit [Cyphellophora europaea CBS 101466]ETN42069.1 prefoldin, alpha subunit [Cyphellophora europaea CBS 101466]